MNTLTDSLKIVNREEGRGTFQLFRRKRAEQYGFALVIFRKQAMLGLISSSDISVESDIQRRYDKIGIKNGDVILSINLGPQYLKINEILPTKDNWPRAYQLEMDLTVNEPIQFAQRYMQETDPVAWGQRAIEGYIQHAARFWDHDEITETMLREWALQALNLPQNTTSGMTVKAVHKAFLHMNPQRAKEIELDRRRALEQKEIETKGYLKRTEKQQDIDYQQLSVQGELDLEHFRAEERRKALEAQTAFERAEAIKQKEHDDAQHLIELEEQHKRQGRNFLLQSADVEQQLSIDARRKRHEQDMVLFTLIEETKQIGYQQQLETQRVTQQIAMQKQAFENRMRQEWIAKIGEGAIPGLIARIQEQLADEKSSLGSAANDPELQYLLDIFSGGQSMPKQLNAASAPSQSAGNTQRVSPVPESGSSAQQTVTGQFRTLKTLPGVVQQSEDTVEIPDLGLRMIQATLSNNQIEQTGSSIGYIVYQINAYGPVKQELQVGDIIVLINNEELHSINEVSLAMSKSESGTEVTLHYLRGHDVFNELNVALARV